MILIGSTSFVCVIVTTVKGIRAQRSPNPLWLGKHLEGPKWALNQLQLIHFSRGCQLLTNSTAPLTTGHSKKLEHGCGMIYAVLLLSLMWGWRTVVVPLSGFYCRLVCHKRACPKGFRSRASRAFGTEATLLTENIPGPRERAKPSCQKLGPRACWRSRVLRTGFQAFS